MADIIDRDQEAHPLRKDDLSNPTNRNGQGEFHLQKFGLASANDVAPAGTIISNIYEPEDEYQNLYIGASRDQGIIQPPYYLRTLDRLSQENNSLAPCIEAMVTNIDGTGYTFENKDKAEDEVEDAGDDVNMDVLKDFFNEPWPGISFRTMRKLVRRDLERVGNAYLEILRNPQDEIIFIRHVDAKMMRIVRLDDPVPVTKTVIRQGQPVSIKVMTRERRFTQDVNGITLVYFKEFGASRDINKNTGLWLAQGSRLPANQRGTEIIHFINLPDAHTPYGIPRWVNQLPSILGSRRAEEFNLEFFEHGGVPPVLILLQGGALAKETKRALEMKTTGSAKKTNRVQVLEVEPSGGTWEQQALTRVTVERFGGDRTKDSMFEEYDTRCELRVRRSFRLPPIFIGAANDYTFASAYASYTVAEAQVFKPEREEFDEIISMLLIPAMGFAGYGMKSKPLTIEDATQKLQGVQIAVGLAVVNEADIMKEVNEAVGTKLKVDDKLVKIKMNGRMGLNPDGTKPVIAAPGTPGTAIAGPSSGATNAGAKSPSGDKGPKAIGSAVAKPSAQQAKGKQSTPIKPPSQNSGKGAMQPGKASNKAGKMKKVKVKFKKTEEELSAFALRVAQAMFKHDEVELSSCLSDVVALDDDERSELRELTSEALGILKAQEAFEDDPGCSGHSHVEKAASGAPNRAHAALADRLIKGKSAGMPILNDGTGTLPGPLDTEDMFAVESTRNAISHSATSDDRSGARGMGRFMRAMAPASKN